jgi:beta-lactam-binding protein with PASTA domain/predicted Ser/Thr protein kinase
MAVSEDSLIDSLFDGRYRIVRKLGAGGMADVYLAEDQELGRRVAIKILNDRHANDEQFIERFRREAKNAAALNHPNIVSIYDRGEAEDTYYIAMEYLDGRSLKELIVGHGPAPVNVAIEYARQILSALRFAHRHGIVHRDIKPHNVLVDREGRVKVTDFGIARAGTSQMTEAGSIVGTAQYLSPEQARGGEVDQRSDLYSLGVVLYELLTGKTPFEGDTPVEIAMKHLSTTPPQPSTLRSDLPHDLDMVVMRALAKDPEDRYQTADEMEADLERVARGAPVAAVTTDAATQVIRSAAVVAPAATSATMIAPRAGATTVAPPPAYYDEYAEQRPRRPIWPWLVALLFVIAAGIAGWYVYHQLAGPSHVKEPVGFYVNLHEHQAVKEINSAHLHPHVIHQANEKTPAGRVFRQRPSAGVRIPKGSRVSIWVSTGKPKVAVPDGLVNEQVTQATQQLHAANLKWRIVEVPGPTKGQVTAASPKSGTEVVVGSSVTLNVMKGPSPVNIPDVVGEQLDTATSQLHAAGFQVNTNVVPSSQPANQVVSQNPTGTAPKGSTVTINVSKGPPQATVPPVTGETSEQATQTLQNAGFKVTQTSTATTDPTQDDVVQSQSPDANSTATKGSTVTITVGLYSGPPTTTTTTTVP